MDKLLVSLALSYTNNNDGEKLCKLHSDHYDQILFRTLLTVL